MSFHNELFEDPADRVRDKSTPGSLVLSNPFSLTSLDIIPVPKPTASASDSIKIPTLVLRDNTAKEVEYTVNSNEAKAFRDNRASIVRISTVDVAVGGRMPDTSTGTGFFVNKDGLIATGYHVIKDANKIEVRMDDGKVYKATIHQVDVSKDLALLQVEKKAPAEQFKPVDLAPDTRYLKADHQLIALGFPHSAHDLHLSGITAKSRIPLSEVNLKNGILPGEDKDRKLIKSVGNVAKGNSGGPVFDQATGKVVGVVNLSNQTDTYFNPIEDLQQFLERVKPVINPLNIGLPSSLLPSSRATDFWKLPAREPFSPRFSPFSIQVTPTEKPAEKPSVAVPVVIPRPLSLQEQIKNLGK